MRQREKLLKIMLDNPNKKTWLAKDFQHGENFIGYEASARMSELSNLYSNILITGKEGRFRTLSIDWTKEKEIKEELERLEILKNENENI